MVRGRVAGASAEAEGLLDELDDALGLARPVVLLRLACSRGRVQVQGSGAGAGLGSGSGLGLGSGSRYGFGLGFGFVRAGAAAPFLKILIVG
jgi:hypothetical protein